MSRVKKIIGTLIVCLLLQISIAIINSNAADEDIFKGVDISKNGDGSVVATLSQDGTTLTITGTGEMASYGGSLNEKIPWINFKTRITTVIIKKGVTNIGMDVFSGCSTLANISIPDSVTTIEQGPFSHCDSLVNINIPSSVTYIRENAFNFCKNLKIINVSTDNAKYMSEDGILFNKQKTEIIRYPEGKRCEKYIMPSTITRINDCAFMNCYLKDISFTKNITSIGRYSFSGCKLVMLISDEEEIMPDILKKALDKNDILYTTKEFEFKNCAMNANGDKIKIDKSTENAISVKVNDGILNNLTVVFLKKEMDISDNHDKSVIVTFSEDFSTLTIAGNGKMKDWHSNIYLDQNNRTYNRPWDDIKELVTKIEIQQGVTNIGTYAFYYCSGLTHIEIPNSVTSIGYCAFFVCSSLIEISIPSEITRIEEGTFSHCSSLTSINIPEKVTVIGIEAFSGCSNLKNIILPSGVTRIGTGAFIGCSSLEFIRIPSSVTSIGTYAFSYCSGLTNIEIPNSVISIGGNAFNNCSNLMSINVESNNTKYISIDGILFNKEMTEIIMYPVGNEENKYTIPNTVTKIGDGAFSGNKNLTNIEIPNSVIRIGDSAFSNCSNLTKLEIPNSVIDMGDSIFIDCINLTSINIPNGVTRVGSHAFCRCSSLTSIKIPSSVTSIGWNAFRFCSSLTSVSIPKEVTKIDSYAFGECNSLILMCKSGTTAETYAKENNIKYIIDDNSPQVDVSYSTTAQTNKDVKVTITANEGIQGITGWTISEDRKTLTKTYEANTEEEMTILDLVGNEVKAQIKINNIDKIALEVKSIRYSETNPTNKNVTIEIEVNKEIQQIEGWNYKENTGNKVITKTYTKNTEEEIIIKDLLGNETKAQVKISNIDRTAPTIEVNKNLSTDRTKCTVTLTANEEIQGATGWTLSEDKKTLTKTYEANTTEEVTVKDLAGNESKGTITITNILKATTVNVKTYVVENNTIKNIQPNTSYTEFIKNITSNKEIVVEEGNTQVTGTNIIKTGQVLTVGEKNYTLIVTGDCNCDGQANIKDILQINKHRLNKTQLTGVYYTAADVNKDGKVDIKDILQLNKYRLGKIKNL